jgi:predicted permease
VLVETLLLSSGGALLSAPLARWVGDLLVAQLSTVDNPVMLDLRPDPLVMLFMGLAAFLTAMLFGAAPAWRATRVAPGDMLKAAGRTATARDAMSPALVVAQVALSMILVVASGLFIRTTIGLAWLDLGIDSARILLVNVDVARTGVAPANRAAFIYSIVNRLGALPGVESASASRVTPIGGGGIIDEITVAGGVPDRTGESTYGLPRFWDAHSAMLNIVTPGWFATYGMTIRRGRAFADADLTGTDPVAIVNEAFVRKFLSDREPLGSRVVQRIGNETGTRRTVVGIVNDAVYDSLRGGVRPVMFVPLVRQVGGPAAAMGGPTTIPLSIRSTTGDPAALSGAVAAALSSLEPNLSFSFRALPDRVAATFANERLLAILSGFFGGLALLLAAIGLYGVTAYSVARRRSEIGIRLALGAASHQVVSQVLAQLFVLVGIGVIVGGVASVWLTRFVAGLLYGLEPYDPGTLASATAILAAAGVLAGWLPAYRASRIDPAEILREN